MRISYYPDTDSLYIDLSSKPSADSREVSDGVVLDYDEDGNLAGIDIDEASTKPDFRELILNKLPAQVKQVAYVESKDARAKRLAVRKARTLKAFQTTFENRSRWRA